MSTLKEKLFKKYVQNFKRSFIASYVLKTNRNGRHTKSHIKRKNPHLIPAFLNLEKTKVFVAIFFSLQIRIKQDVYMALGKMTSGGIFSVDGKSLPKNHVTLSDEAVKEIEEHTRSFPIVPPHYCRQSSDKIYLETFLNISIMYRLYVELQGSKGKSCAKIHKFHDVFLKEFNLGFFSRRKTNVICVHLSAPHLLN